MTTINTDILSKVNIFLILLSVTYADIAEDVQEFTGRHTKIVWARSLTGIAERDVSTANYSLVGLDTHTGTEREIISGPGSCANPWITPDGTRVIYTDWPNNKVCIVNWSGADNKVLMDGFALTVWRDPDTSIEWIYVSEKPYGDTITRYQIDNISEGEIVWSHTQSSIRFSLSADGTHGGGEFPWNRAGVISLPNGVFHQYGNGCNASIAPDNSYRFFHQVGTHREIIVYDDGGTNRRIVPLNTAPGINGHSVWIPKWSNSGRFITMSGPESAAETRNNIYMGAFNSDFTEIEKWIRISDDTGHVELYAYAWLNENSPFTFSPESLAFTIDENDTTILEKRIDISHSADSVSEISVRTDAQWLALSITGDGNVRTIINSVHAGDMPSGEYRTGVIVTGDDGKQAGEYVVTLTILAEPYLDTITVTPCDAMIKAHETIQFSARALDQYNNPINTDLQWAVSGGGEINQSGLFTSNGENGMITITASAVQDSTVAGTASVKVYDNVMVYSPSGGETYSAGDVLPVRWIADTTAVQAVSIELTFDGGRIWYTLNPAMSIQVGDSCWGDFCWPIPDSLHDAITAIPVSTASERCKIRVSSYTNLSINAQSAVFSIHENATSIHGFSQPSHANQLRILQRHNGDIIITTPDAQEPFWVKIISFDGATLLQKNIRGKCRYILRRDMRPAADGAYILQLQGLGKTCNKQILFLK